ncbi:hypothetical protein K9U39_10955 [Rhodoblastus acidophilus]|uniref:Phage tail tape measure protein n=1 Tax=Candidatus Rhodoblastus alkanivorans TaxID=2954117 RepID=A0ABS9Z8X0_9HYPH|nr:hypothetical protein [Candidatus Rhodoblastus alkanivorans]MCI4680173.1 hypothetical protein [Candidatus Rhodoblastus alkanivorans]MCI4684130.1 hypothetical protein [Candidatus Rhodoblastus alkanivorans]MDI4641450.1 hypothetical protein [Rhodoblastus acidophilus]
MAQSNVSISFGADASDFLDGVARVSASLQSLPTGVNQVAAGLAKTSQSFSAFGAGAANALAKTGEASREASASQRDAAHASLAEINGEIFAERLAFSEKKSLYDALSRLKIVSADERLAATQRALASEYSAEKALIARELQLGDLSVQQREDIQNRNLALDARYALESQKIMLQSVQQMVGPMGRVVDSMASSFASGLTGMIFHARTLNQAMASVAQSVVSHFIRMGVEVVADWGKRQIALVVLSQTAESQKTAAALSGAAAREGIAGGEATSGLASIIANAIKSITVSAGEAGAGAAAFMAPFIGPGAVAEGAAVKGAVLAMGAYDIGAWQIDQDQIAMVHRNEMVMPAAEAGAFRSMLTNAANGGAAGAAGGGDTHVHLNVSALDAGSVKSWLSNNSRQIMKALDGAVRNGDHLGLRRLATG